MIEPGAAPAKLPGVGESGSETPAWKGEKWHMTQVWVASLAATHTRNADAIDRRHLCARPHRTKSAAAAN